jgi:hypothetical protein
MPKRIAKSESPVGTGMPRTKRASATHSKKSPAQATTETIETIETIPSAAATPDREVIARLAYSYWQERGCSEGSPEDDWLRAEQELLRKR